ncbi:MAG: DUF222 domain-containing protein [Micromonosporaceae bacterium]
MGDILERVSGAPLWSLSDAQVAELTAEAAQVQAQMAALSLALIAEADGRGIAARAGAASTQTWLRGQLHCSPGTAKRRVMLARSLSGDLGETRGALADGVISEAHAEVIARAVDELPGGEGTYAATRRRAESQLVRWAQQFDPAQLTKLGRRIWEVADPAGADAREARHLAELEKRAHSRRELTFSDDGHGTTWVLGRMDPESAATVRRAIDALSKPRPTDTHAPDVRSPAARRLDAFVEVCRRSLDAGELPVQGGERLSPTTIRRIACDAQLLPAVLGGDSIPLELGRAQRLFTSAQRRALTIRDKGCAFPCCDLPPAWCQAHHVTHWIDGGASDTNNGVLLCGHHRVS